MKRLEYDKKELEIIGVYPAVKSFGKINGEYRIPDSPRYNRPITPRDNFKMMLDGKRPYWIPFTGLAFSDKKEFRPRILPDAIANHQIFDGGDEYPFENEGKVRTGWFGIEWEYDYEIRGATVRPGEAKISDIEHWEDVIEMPNLDELDWERCEKENIEFLQDDRLRELGIQCAFWERLLSLMDATDAAVALVDEDMQKGVHRLFDKLADLYIDFIRRIKAICEIDIVIMHDDWGHQNGPFISIDIAREMIVPYLKRVTDYCHDNGLYFELHSCGKNEMLVPAYIEAGVDFWCGQPALNDLYSLANQYKDYKFTFGIGQPVIPNGSSNDEIRKIAKKFVEEIKDCNVALTSEFFDGVNTEFKDAVYEYSRIIWQDEEK